MTEEQKLHPVYERFVTTMVSHLDAASSMAVVANMGCDDFMEFCKSSFNFTSGWHAVQTQGKVNDQADRNS